MSKLYNNYSPSVSWRSREFDRREQERKEAKNEPINKAHSMEIPRHVVKDRWQILKTKYPHLQIREEYDKWVEARRKKGRAEIQSPILALTFFEEDQLKNKPAPIKRLSTETEREALRKDFFEKEKQIILHLLSECGICMSPSIEEQVQTAVYKEGLSHYSVQDWVKDEGCKPVYPCEKELHLLIAKRRTE